VLDARRVRPAVGSAGGTHGAAGQRLGWRSLPLSDERARSIDLLLRRKGESARAGRGAWRLCERLLRAAGAARRLEGDQSSDNERFDSAKCVRPRALRAPSGPCRASA